MAQVFISYSRKDLAFVNQLAADLKKTGLDVWYDVSGIGGGSRWRTEIENALRNSEYVVVVLSPDSVASEWVEREFIFSSKLKRKIVPLMYRSCELPLNYVDLEYVDVEGENYGRNFGKLLNALKVEVKKGTQPIDIQPPSRSKGNRVFLIGGGIIILAALFGLYLIINGNPTGSPPTDAVDVTREPTSVEVPSGPIITETGPGLTPTAILTPTVPPLATETTDDRGVIMVLIPAGTFTMGSENGEDDEKPVHTVDLDAYYLDKFEVTNLLYGACVDAGVCDPPTDNTHYNNKGTYAQHPVIYVDWQMSKTYCEWRGARLPTEAEWEKAARGTNAFIYPWGNGLPDISFANYFGAVNGTSEVGAYEKGKSPYGIFDMAGNVWEWVADFYEKEYYRTLASPAKNPLGPGENKYHVIRGGSWHDNIDANQIRSSHRLRHFYTEGGDDLGFRCARDATP